MDFKKILAGFDAVENDVVVEATEKKKQDGSMLAILESFNRVETAEEEVVAEETEEVTAEEEVVAEETEEVTAEEEVVAEETEEELEEAIMVSAEGDEAAQLLSILQLAGMKAPEPAMPAPMEPEMEMQDEYSNSPDEVEQDVDAVIASGDDLHREKEQFAAAADGDNPMKAFEGKFKSILDELLAEEEK